MRYLAGVPYLIVLPTHTHSTLGSQVARSFILVFFNEIFDGLCKLSADPDPHVKSGAQLLDKLIKDIVTESSSFDIEKFIPLLRERIYVINPFVRQFLISWIHVLNNVPDLDILEFLPQVSIYLSCS